METAIGHQAPQIIELSEESKQKVMLLHDINSIFKLVSGGYQLTPKLFDMLYDSSVKELENTYYNYRNMYNMQSVVN